MCRRCRRGCRCGRPSRSRTTSTTTCRSRAAPRSWLTTLRPRSAATASCGRARYRPWRPSLTACRAAESRCPPSRMRVSMTRRRSSAAPRRWLLRLLGAPTRRLSSQRHGLPSSTPTAASRASRSRWARRPAPMTSCRSASSPARSTAQCSSRPRGRRARSCTSACERPTASARCRLRRGATASVCSAAPAMAPACTTACSCALRRGDGGGRRS
mmetsp:Transcript_26964/g.93608  ORF Transcript_26964/g.93608 Transcript_26964/m.93608 type:complete len:214 (+) Transcript_26964:378-1019(+)